MNAKPYLLAMTAVALTLNATTSFGQVFDTVDARSNRAVAASPRANEEFPWLLRSVTQPSSGKMATPTTRSALAVVKDNGSLSLSPRMQEHFAELSRGVERIVEIAPLK